MFPSASSVGKGIGRAFSNGRGDLDLDRSEGLGDNGDDGRTIIGEPASGPSFSGVAGGGGDRVRAAGSSTGGFSGKNVEA